MTGDELRQFREAVWDYYHTEGRHDLPWRQPLPNGEFDPYRIMVSEIMLQQTQVSRVIPKYQGFLEQFPTLNDLAKAGLGDVLRIWNGLGYNRRAKFLHQAAQAIINDHGGVFPKTVTELVTLPGIGKNTAGAIVVYAYNRSAIFIETNIRTVFIHHFFKDQGRVGDKAITECIEATLNTEHPREWYWALMDYGSYLKKEVGNLNVLSKSYNKQSKFHGSKRQIRGQVIRLLSQQSLDEPGLKVYIQDTRLTSVLDDLLKEGLVNRRGNQFSI